MGSGGAETQVQGGVQKKIFFKSAGYNYLRSRHMKDSKERLFLISYDILFIMFLMRHCVVYVNINKRSFESFMCLDLVLER